jgi:hypothetical protein
MSSVNKIALAHAFEAFANFGNTKMQQDSTSMDNTHFAKLCRDCNIVSKQVTSVDVDIAFKKVSIYTYYR